MARLPTVQDFGARPLGNVGRTMVSANYAGGERVAEAAARQGQVLTQVGDLVFDRNATAMAKERDTIAADAIRDVLYNPENGFANKRGRAAVDSYAETLKALDSIAEQAKEGLNATAARKLDSSLRSRLEGARNKMATHTASARTDWINGATQARIESAQQDAIFDLDNTSQSIATIESEYADLARRNGWSAEERDLNIQKAKSNVFTSQAGRISQADPIVAMEYLQKNRDSILPSDYVAMEARLIPEVKRYSGRATARALVSSLGSMEAVFSVAQDTMGMNENERRATLHAYMTKGGQGLDPKTQAWCAAWVNATLARAGMNGTGSAAARSFLSWGEAVETPQRGDVVVLSRGSDPTKGHVGFFDSYGPNGEIRLLGGNQDDGVNVTGYDNRRVLGFRRAPAQQIDEGTVLRMRQQLLAIDDPIKRAAAVEEFNANVSNMAALQDYEAKEAGRTAARNAANWAESEYEWARLFADAATIDDPVERTAVIDELNLQAGAQAGLAAARAKEVAMDAFSHVEAGGSIDDLPLDTRQSLGRTEMSALRSYQNSRASRTPVETDPQTYADLYEMSVNDPQAFRQENLVGYVDKLSATDFKAFIQKQNDQPDDITRAAASSLMSTAKRQIEAAGIDATPKPGSAEAVTMAGIQTRLVKWQDMFVAKNGRAPTQAEQEERIAMELVPVALDPPGWWNEVEGVMADLRDVEVDQLAGASVTIGGLEIPAEVVQEQIAALQAAGQDVTTEAVLDRIMNLLSEAGQL